MTGAWGGVYGAGSYGMTLEAAERKLEKYTGKVQGGQRCGFPPSKKKCVKKQQKFDDIVMQLRAEQVAVQSVLAATDPNLAAQMVADAGAANLAAVQESSSTTPYIVGGIVLVGSLVAGFLAMSGGK